MKQKRKATTEGKKMSESATTGTVMTDAEKRAASRVKFQELANKRTANVVGRMRLIGNLARYEHTPDDTTIIINALSSAVTELREQLSKTKRGRMIESLNLFANESAVNS